MKRDGNFTGKQTVFNRIEQKKDKCKPISRKKILKYIGL